MPGLLAATPAAAVNRFATHRVPIPGDSAILGSVSWISSVNCQAFWQHSRRRVILATLLGCAFTATASAQSTTPLAARIQKVLDRPEFAHANFGIEFYSLDSGKIVYALNADKLFVPASTTKLLTEGALLAKFGADYRFHTRIYRTAALDKKGRLKGDLILVASGDPNLSNRIQADGSLAFMDVDHSYGGPAVKGNPLAVIKKLAQDVAASGVRKIDGRVIVDASLFPDGAREGGTSVVVSSIAVNDNVIDVRIAPGAKAGEPALLVSSPQTSYARFVNQVMTGAAGGKQEIADPDVVTKPDGSVVVTIAGSIPAGGETANLPFAVPSPTTFTETVLRESLAEAGVAISKKKQNNARSPNFVALSRYYTAENQLAEHVSLPLAEEVKLTLKVSQNLHAAMGPYLLGVFRGKRDQDALKVGFEVERLFLRDAKLDLSGASQGDGEGTDWADLFSPDFMVQYLAYWTTRPDYATFFGALPILGKDGTLAKIQVESPAAGSVHAKTGTSGSGDRLNGKMMLNGKGLAGYIITKSGQKLAFAAFVNHVSLSPDPDAAQQVAGQALGEIAAAAYDAELPAAAVSPQGDAANSSR